MQRGLPARDVVDHVNTSKRWLSSPNLVPRVEIAVQKKTRLKQVLCTTALWLLQSLRFIWGHGEEREQHQRRRVERMSTEVQWPYFSPQLAYNRLFPRTTQILIAGLAATKNYFFNPLPFVSYEMEYRKTGFGGRREVTVRGCQSLRMSPSCNPHESQVFLGFL